MTGTPDGSPGPLPTAAASRRAWARAPYNVGIACGPSRLVVVDLDTPKPGDTPPREWDRPGVRTGADVLAAAMRRGRGTLPGRHLDRVHPERGNASLLHRPARGRDAEHPRAALGWLTDTRAGGGYVVGAGSTVNGRAYHVARDLPPAALPGWLTDRLRPVQLPPQRAVEVSLPAGRAGATYGPRSTTS